MPPPLRSHALSECVLRARRGVSDAPRRKPVEEHQDLALIEFSVRKMRGWRWWRAWLLPLPLLSPRHPTLTLSTVSRSYRDSCGNLIGQHKSGVDTLCKHNAKVSNAACHSEPLLRDQQSYPTSCVDMVDMPSDSRWSSCRDSPVWCRTSSLITPAAYLAGSSRASVRGRELALRSRCNPKICLTQIFLTFF